MALETEESLSAEEDRMEGKARMIQDERTDENYAGPKYEVKYHTTAVVGSKSTTQRHWLFLSVPLSRGVDMYLAPVGYTPRYSRPRGPRARTRPCACCLHREDRTHVAGGSQFARGATRIVPDRPRGCPPVPSSRVHR